MAKRTAQTPWKRGNRLVGYDPDKRRVWIGGQRVHHGLTGLIVAGTGLAGMAARRVTPSGALRWTLLGTALVAHDWQDRSVWFERGPQDD